MFFYSVNFFFFHSNQTSSLSSFSQLILSETKGQRGQSWETHSGAAAVAPVNMRVHVSETDRSVIAQVMVFVPVGLYGNAGWKEKKRKEE